MLMLHTSALPYLTVFTLDHKMYKQKWAYVFRIYTTFFSFAQSIPGGPFFPTTKFQDPRLIASCMLHARMIKSQAAIDILTFVFIRTSISTMDYCRRTIFKICRQRTSGRSAKRAILAIVPVYAFILNHVESPESGKG